MADMKTAAGGKNFPRPYVDSVNENDPMMERVPFDMMDIGARRSGMPKGDELSSKSLGIDHVGGSAGKKG